MPYLVYIREEAPAFRASCELDAASRFPDDRAQYRNPRFYQPRKERLRDICGVYVETQFAGIINDYREAGLPVVTEGMLGLGASAGVVTPVAAPAAVVSRPAPPASQPDVDGIVDDAPHLRSMSGGRRRARA